jgi:hypothetical protein
MNEGAHAWINWRLTPALLQPDGTVTVLLRSRFYDLGFLPNNLSPSFQAQLSHEKLTGN